MEKKIYLDTFVFMDLLSDNKEYAKKAVAYLEKIKSGEFRGVVSSILFSELSFHIKRRKGREKAEEILYYIESVPNLSIIPVDNKISKEAGFLRARYLRKIQKKLTYFDSIHLATAILEGCEIFVTGDKGFREIRDIKIEIY